MNRELRSPNAGSTIVGLLQPYEGGTGQSTPAGALAALNGVAASKINQPNGIAGLDSAGKLPTNQLPLDNLSVVSLQGSVNLLASSSNVFTLTNFDSFSAYAITVSAGSYSIIDDVLTYVAPSTAQAVTLTINGRSFVLNIASYFVNDPVLSVTDTASGPTNSALVGVGTDFSTSSSGGSHLNSDWQVATDSSFSNIVSQSMADAANKTSWTSGALNRSTTYYMRVRYRDSNNAVSNWSNTFTITTKATYIPQSESAILSAADKAGSNWFGFSVSMSSDGSRVVVGAYGYDGTITDQGKAYVFLRTGNSWTQEADLLPDAPATSANFGKSVAISGDGSRIMVGSPDIQVARGRVYVYLRTGTTWAQEASLTAVDLSNNALFGSALSMTPDGSRAVIGANGFTSNQGKAYIFLRTGTTWAQEASFVATDTTISAANFGTVVSITSDGSRVVIGSPSYTAGSSTSIGKAYIFLRTGTAWAQEAIIQPNDITNSAQFGRSVAISSDGSRVVIGAHGFTGTLTNQGKAYVFLRTGTSWAQEAALLPSDLTANARFGFSAAMSSDGARLVIGAYGFNSQRGKAYIFSRTGTTWTQEAAFQASDASVDAWFGQSVSMNDTGNMMAVGAYAADPGGVGNAGAVYIFI